MKISYLPQVQIDKTKWDHCIETAGNGLIYAYSFYLDAMSKNWDALVLNDYETVMPLPWNKKYNICYLYQPFFCAQLGIFGNSLSEEIVRNFLENIPSRFRYWDFYLNKDNLYSLDGFPMYERNNYVLSLRATSEILEAGYAQSHRRNIKRALHQGNRVIKDIPVAEVIALAKEQTRSFSTMKQKDYTNFSKLYSLLHEQRKAVTYGVYSSQHQLTASCAYFFSHHRAYYILVGNHPEGRTSGASHLLIDHFIKEHAGKNMLLDFEGSSVNSLAFFYKSFGAVQEIYPGIKLNSLPIILKLFRQ